MMKSAEKWRRQNATNARKYADFAAIASVVDPIIGRHGLSYRFHTVQTIGPIGASCALRGGRRGGSYARLAASYSSWVVDVVRQLREREPAGCFSWERAAGLHLGGRRAA
jgi:hypothetical protein